MEEQYRDIEKLVKEAGIQEPTSDFMKKVMDQIAVTTTQASLDYQPLISRKVWWSIGILVLVIISIWQILLGGTTFFKVTIDFSFLTKGIGDVFSGYTFNKATVYGTLFLALLFIVQVSVLKRRNDKSFSSS